MTSEERLTEIRDLLADLLSETRSSARKQDEIHAGYRTAGIVLLLVFLFYLLFLQ